METKYECIRCNYKSRIFKDIVRHWNRMHLCKKNQDNQNMLINYSDDQSLILSMIPLKDNKRIINMEDLQYLDDSSMILDNKKELFEKMDEIENKCSKQCQICNKNFSKVFDLKMHLLNNCYYTHINNKHKEKIKELEIKDKIIEEKVKDLILFDNDWDISHISKEKKIYIITTNFMYTILLEEVFINEMNLNIIMNKNILNGYIYVIENEKKNFVEIQTESLVIKIMSKLNKLLNDMVNNTDEDFMKELKSIILLKINKKLNDFHNNEEIKNKVITLMGNICLKNRSRTIDISKKLLEEETNLYGY